MANELPLPGIGRLLLLLFLLAGCVSVIGSSSPSPDLRILSAEKRVDLTSSIVRVHLTLKVENSGTCHATEISLAFSPTEAEHLAIVKASLSEGKLRRKKYTQLDVDPNKLSNTPNGAKLFSISLSNPLKTGETAVIEVLYILTHLLEPFPAEIGQSESQLVYYRDSATLLSPYHVVEQIMYVKTPTNKIESFTVVDPTNRAGKELKYGPYHDHPPYSFSSINVHFENNNPFAVVEELVRELELSHWGSLQVKEYYTLKHAGARHKGIFSRLEYQARPSIHGASAFKQLLAKLPPRVHSVYYRDEIGNISSSNLRTDYQKSELEIEPRYPLFGGWKATFIIGYSVPLEDFLFESPDGQHYLNFSFGCPLQETLVDSLTIRVVLPEGSKSPSAALPFQADQYLSKTYSYLDVVGRPTVVIQKKNVVPEHNIPFQVHYNFSPIFMLAEPLMLTTHCFKCSRASLSLSLPPLFLEMEMSGLVCLLGLLLCLCSASMAQMPGFLSLDCGGTEKHIDSLGLEWNPDDQTVFGGTATISTPGEARRQYTTVRYFPADDKKYCYTLQVQNRTRYLVRATFLYGNFGKSDAYPKFDISLGTSQWSTIIISDENTIEVKELIFLATLPTVSICLSNATTGQPFISTLELRQFNGSLYYTTVETHFFLSLSARINFGSESNDSIRYPDDPFDRIWESDSLRRANYLVDVAPGTKKISTTEPVDVSYGERPPQKVMQTAVVGLNGSLSYRLDLDGFPGFGWAFSYFAEIEDFLPGKTRKFKLFVPGISAISKPTVDVQENAPGKFRLYEPGYYNISLPFIFSFEFKKTNDSFLGPILNALEIYKYLQINYGSQDASIMVSLVSHYTQADWAHEGGDPCLPASWSWVQCNSDPQPKIVSINLSGKNITGNVPLEFTKLTGLIDLRLDDNLLTGLVPDFSECINLETIHLENNQLTGELPSTFADLPNLIVLNIMNNKLSGAIPQELIDRHISLNYEGNADLHGPRNGLNHTLIIIIFVVLGVFILLAALMTYFLFARKRNKSIQKGNAATIRPAKKLSTYFSEVATESAHRFALSEIEEATGKFQKKIGSGGFGIVYYGRLKDGKEIAVKVLTNESYQGIREFLNEVTLLSRIHHRNLVTFLGYSQQDGKNILVYEFMPNGTLKENLRGLAAFKRTVNWINRLQIAEGTARGIEYLHTGCSPTIIHRDLKSSNILLDMHMRAKVADFGLSKPAVDGSHVSSIVRGTVGYLDPEYYTSQQLTEKSDIYSLGIILLELISGQEPISNERFGANCRNIVAWATSYIEGGNIQAIIDPSLEDDFELQSMWKIAEVAILCVKPHGVQRPSISLVLKEIQEAIAIEQGSGLAGDRMMTGKLPGSSLNMDTVELAGSERNVSFPDVFCQPGLR